MNVAFQVLIFIGVFALAVGLLGIYIGSAGSEMRKLRAAHDSRHLARQRRDVDQASRRDER